MKLKLIIFSSIMYILTYNNVYAQSTNCLPNSIKSQLSYINNRFGKVKVISTFRKNARTPKGTRSYHASCRAVDFHVYGNKQSAIRYLKSNWPGGVGTYSGRLTHIHIDNGPRYRWHTSTGSKTFYAKTKTTKNKSIKRRRTNKVYTKTRRTIKRQKKEWAMNWNAH